MSIVFCYSFSFLFFVLAFYLTLFEHFFYLYRSNFFVKIRMSTLMNFQFEARIWNYSSVGSWFFVSLPKSVSQEIRTAFHWREEGWGRLKVKASIGKTTWDTAIWYDTKFETYLLPLKAEIRRKEYLNDGNSVSVILFLSQITN